MSIKTKKNPILIDIPMPIETPRLILRNVLPGDGKALFEAKVDSFKELNK
ncbi:MAG: N-acetyltransferase, partial [Micavibrio aeruginosavorus]